MTPPELAAKAASLSEVQRSYLRLVAKGLTSKQIAQTLGGSHHTVNVQIGVAMRILGATSRGEAATILGESERGCSYEPSYEAPALAAPAATADTRRQDEAGGEQSWQVPFATRLRPINTLSMGSRVGWILVIATTTALLLGGLVSGVATMMASLDRLI